MRLKLAVLICLAASTFGAGVAQASFQHQYQGRRVEEVLRQLQAEGARIMFSSTLVPSELRVKAEPRGRTPREIAEEILAPHGLALTDGPGKTWLVVRAATGRPQPAAETPATEQTRPPAGPPGAPGETPAMRIEERVDVIDRLGDLAGQPSVYTLDSRKVLETAGGLENVFQVLATLPGVAATDDEQGKLAIRGGGPEHNVIVFDGVQIHSSQRIGDFGTSFVNPATTGSIALDASGLDARYGGRLSSVTILETRDGSIDRRLAVSGSAGLTSGDLLVEGRLPGTTSGSWWVSTRGTYYKYVAERFRGGGVPGFADLQLKVTAKPTPRTRLSLLGLVGRETMSRPLGEGNESPFISGGVSRAFVADNRLAVANLSWTPGGHLTTTTTVTAYSNASHYQDHWTFRPTGPFDRRIRVDDVAVRQRATVGWSRGHVLDVGMEARHLNSRWRMKSTVPSPDSRAVGPDTWGGRIEYDGPIDSRITRNQLGAWAQDRIPIGRALALEPGVRVDWNSFTDESALQPRLRVTRTTGRAIVWAGVAWQAQTPGHETMQQGISYYDLTGPESANLNNERSRQVVLGVEGHVGRTTAVRVEAYRRRFDRLLVQRQETEPERLERLAPYVLPPDLPADSAILEYRPTIHPASTGTGRASGLEILLQRHQGRVSGWVGYALSKSERELYGRTVPSDFDRRHALSVALNAEVSPRVGLSATSHYASGFALTPVHPEVFFGDTSLPPRPPPFRAFRNSTGGLVAFTDPNNPLRLSLLNSARMPAYARTDVRVTFKLAKWVEVYGEVINVFNRENFHPSALFGASRSPGQYEVAPSLPRLPTYGVRVKF